MAPGTSGFWWAGAAVRPENHLNLSGPFGKTQFLWRRAWKTRTDQKPDSARCRARGTRDIHLVKLNECGVLYESRH